MVSITLGAVRVFAANAKVPILRRPDGSAVTIPDNVRCRLFLIVYKMS